MRRRGAALLVLLAAAGAAGGCAPGPRPQPVVSAPLAPAPGPEWPDLESLTATTGEPAYPDDPGPQWPDLAAELDRDPAAARRAPVLIRVGLKERAPRAALTCAGPAFLLAEDGTTRLARLEAGERAEFSAVGRKVRWRASGGGGEVAGVTLQPVDPADAVSWEKARYRGALQVLARSGGLVVINALGLEDYLRGVVPGEIGRLGPQGAAALEAQAIAARTYTIAHRGQHDALGFDVWADTRDQVYDGLAGEDSICDAAVERTAGLVLQHEGREIEAYYSSTCGGRTANCEEVWPRDARPYLAGRRDAPRDGAGSFCAGSPRFSWEESWRAADLERILQRTLPAYLDDMRDTRRAAWAGATFTPRGGGSPRHPGRLLGIAVRARTSCGRVAVLDVTTEAGVYHVRGDRTRSVLLLPDGRRLLWSALFRLRVEMGSDGRPERIVVNGRGFGHGVGMCQMGAIAMARRGFTSGQILAHYYTGAELALYAADGAAFSRGSHP